MFTHVDQPLVYAQTLLTHFMHLAQAPDHEALVGGFVQGVAGLSGCELVQLYVLDATHTRLGLSAQYLNGHAHTREGQSVPADYNGEQLLQFALCQNRVVCLSDLNTRLHELSFLPAGVVWNALLCVPLLNQKQTVEGVLLCASQRQQDLNGFAESLAQLGSFVLGQLHVQHALRLSSGDVPAPLVSEPSVSGYGLIGESPVMRETYSLISKVLHSPYTVLLLGETGSGKEVVARAIHDYGPRRSKPFIVQNCAAFPENLLESELFGFRKGAFTGADCDRRGLFDAANGGTLLLDEIGDMPLSLQAKLLRVLQEGEIRPLGSNDTHTIDVRIIAATHRDLAVLVSEGKFREDLYYRLAQFPIELPPLRLREGDILVLARHFAKKACAFLRRDVLHWSQAALDHLAAYPFPGNVRELKGLVERAVLLCEGRELMPEHFARRADLALEGSSLSLRERLEQVERSWVLDCLRKNDGNQTLAARELGLPRRTLLYRMERLNVQVGERDG